MCAQYGIAHERIGRLAGCSRRRRCVSPSVDRRRRARLHPRGRGASRDHDRAAQLILKPLWRSCAATPACGCCVDGVSSFGAEAHRLRRRSLRGGGRDREQVSARRAGCLVCDRAARAPGAGGEPHLLPGSWPPGAPAGSAQYAVHARSACLLRLVEALREFAEQGGRAARYQHYAALAEQVRAGLAELGIAATCAAGGILGGAAFVSIAGGHQPTHGCTMR